MKLGGGDRPLRHPAGTASAYTYTNIHKYIHLYRVFHLTFVNLLEVIEGVLYTYTYRYRDIKFSYPFF